MNKVKTSNGQGVILEPHDRDLLNDIICDCLANNMDNNEIISHIRIATDLFNDYTDKELNEKINFFKE